MVYAIECAGGKTYVGIEHRSRAVARLRKHWDLNGAFYTQQNKPKSILLFWPAANTAVEGYVFLALLAQLPPRSVERIGGWTQTSTNPAPLPRMIFEQERRCMLSLCFNCGSKDHVAKRCPKPLETAPYKCAHCLRPVLISSRGASQTSPRSWRFIFNLIGDMCSLPPLTSPLPSPKPIRAPLEPSSPPRRQVSESHKTESSSSNGQKPVVAESPQALVQVVPTRKRKAEPQPRVEPIAKVAKTSTRGGKVLLVGGRHYAPLSWFLNSSNPSKKNCAIVKDKCYKDAVEMRKGNMNTLSSYAKALPAGPTFDILGDRSRFSSTWFQTPITVDKGGKLELRKTGEPVEQSLRQVLWLVSDLERWLS